MFTDESDGMAIPPRTLHDSRSTHNPIAATTTNDFATLRVGSTTRPTPALARPANRSSPAIMGRIRHCPAPESSRHRVREPIRLELPNDLERVTPGQGAHLGEERVARADP